MHPLDHHTTEATPNERHEPQHTQMNRSEHGDGHMEHMHHTAMSTSHGTHHDQHGGHAGHSATMFQRPFWVSLVLTIPIVIYAEMIQAIFHYQAPAFPGSYWLSPILASVIYWYCSWIFLKGAFDALRVLRPGMTTL